MPFVRRRPLLRVAAVGGVAYMGSKAGANRAMAQQNQQAQEPQPQAAAPAPVAPPAGATSPAADRIAQLKQLTELRDSGALTQEEFDKEKARLLA